MQKANILLVEDDPNLGEVLKEYLLLKDYDVVLAPDGEEGWKAYRAGDFDLCILDVMMPIKDGFTLAREIREVDNKVPVIFLTAKALKEDTLEGFRLGGDDYITKPFSMEELLMRIKAVLRRTRQAGADITDQGCRIGQYTFDFNTLELRSKSETVRLTTKEGNLLKLLCINKNRTLQRSIALKTVWGDDSYFNARSMDVYIARLRKHFRDEPSVNILTVHGEGFKLVDSSRH
jgi:DNA-binding response OmpR family regulator